MAHRGGNHVVISVAGRDRRYWSGPASTHDGPRSARPSGRGCPRATGCRSTTVLDRVRELGRAQSRAVVISTRGAPFLTVERRMGAGRAIPSAAARLRQLHLDRLPQRRVAAVFPGASGRSCRTAPCRPTQGGPSDRWPPHDRSCSTDPRGSPVEQFAAVDRHCDHGVAVHHAAGNGPARPAAARV